MSQNKSYTKSRKNLNKPNYNKQQSYNRSPKTDNALLLKPEYNGQPVCVLKMNGQPDLVTTTVGAGYSLSHQIQAGNMFNFAARFAGFTEFRIVHAKATFRNFSSSNPGLGNMWFTEDDTTSPSASSALDAKALQFNFAAIDKAFTKSYTPHDPAQQTWTLVSSGNPIIGYLKFYTNITNFGCPSAATALGAIEYEFTVQFRGLV